MTFPYSQITAIVNEVIKDELADAVFKSRLGLERMKKNIVIEDSGHQIKAPLYILDDAGTTGAWYSKGDALSLDSYDGISASQHSWRYLYESIVVSKIELAQAGSKKGQLNLLTAKMKQMNNAFSQRLMKGILSDGGASTGALDTDQIDGLDLAIGSASYGGITTSDLATWLSYVNDNSGTGRAISQLLVDQAMDQATEGGIGGPTVAFMNKAVRTRFKNLLTPFQQTQRVSTVDGLGHQGDVIVYNGVDFITENLMENTSGGDGRIFFVDEKFAKLHVLSGGNFRNDEISSLESQDALLNRVHLYAQLVCNERRFHSELTDLTI